MSVNQLTWNNYNTRSGDIQFDIRGSLLQNAVQEYFKFIIPSLQLRLLLKVFELQFPTVTKARYVNTS